VGRYQREMPANTISIAKKQSNRTLVGSKMTKIDVDAAAAIVAD